MGRGLEDSNLLRGLRAAVRIRDEGEARAQREGVGIVELRLSARESLSHESEVSRTLERSMRAVEPLVMVFIGLGVGIVVVLMYVPISELASAIQ